jgi:hypothetical protein
MKSEKLQIKFFAKPNADFELETLMPVFQRFIRELLFDELLIDVVDYRHVKHGPGVALIGDANDYFLDEGEGRPGLLFSRKRHGSGPEGRLREGFARALKACQLLEAAPELAGKLSFATTEVLIRLPDRLNAPNDDASFAQVSADCAPLLDKLYGAGGYVIERGAGAPEPLAFSVKAKSDPSLAALLATLGG